MASLNRIQVIGRLGHAPKPAGEGKSYRATFSVATEDYGGQTTTWHDVTCWGKTAMAAVQVLERGWLVYVEGELQKRKATNREGIEKEYVSINARNVQFLVAPAGSAPRGESNEAVREDDDIPF